MKHQELISKMTLEEKAAILSGKTVWDTRDYERLNIPSIGCADGPHGIRKQAGAGDHLGLNASLQATCFPTAATMANSWDEKLGEELGAALGEEAAVQDVSILLGPGLNIKRSPLCGRNFEYFSEDPYHAGKMAAAYVRGIQSKGVYACPKHFAVNSQELRRMAMNSVLDERTLREIYLTGFEIAVKEGNAKTIMSSYNEINGVYANENKHLLQEILRDEWGFDGIVITDWGGSNDHVKGVAAGSNLEMPAPGLDSARQLCKAVEEGNLKMEELDSAVDDLLDAILVLSENAKNKPAGFDAKAHHELARRAAQESAVLLKNTDHILPLPPKSKVALIGDFAVDPRYQGAGSSMVNAIQVDTMEKLIKDYDLQVIGVNRGYQRDGKEDAALKKAALDLAGMADIVIYCFGLDELSESEGLDRTHMRIPQNQIDLLGAISQVNMNIVGVLSAGASVEMPWQHCCRAILHGYLNGEAGAGAILDLLTGKVNPSGRLNETYPIRYEDTPAFRNYPSTERNAEYRESVYVGYRYYDTGKIRIQYPFGYGLSYTTFEYSNLKTEKDGVVFTIKNTGDYDGAEVAQMYVSLPGAKVFRPDKELKGFCKIFLKAGESKEVRIPFDDKTFRYWNVKTNRWEVEGGNYAILIGACVSDIRLKGSVAVEGTTTELPYDPQKMPSYYNGLIQQVEDSEFAELLGYPIPQGKWSGLLTENDAICQMYYARSGLARLIYRILTSMKKKSEAKGKPDLNILFIYNMPFRGIAKMTNGAVSMEMVYGMVDVVNGHFLRGMKKIIGGFFANSKANKAYERKLSGK
ncbi:MAG: glycoside hydrolase family 3 C-terminal domain-containing protein [Eubacteriales bacterium]|nr:glycoside hydrolase family 3 C-terminal domain-containing protein [Eubacteriales bacterium]